VAISFQTLAALVLRHLQPALFLQVTHGVISSKSESLLRLRELGGMRLGAGSGIFVYDA
jgi:hypothetical protein